MNLDVMVTQAYKTNWTRINAFTIALTGPPELTKGLDTEINLALKTLSFPAIAAAAIETYLGGRWFYTNGRADMSRIELTFRDYDDFKLYKIFTSIFERAQGDYINTTHIALKVLLDEPNSEPKSFALFTRMVIENVSQITFSNETENQIAEFSVTLKGQRQSVSGTSRYSNSQTKLIG